MAVETLLHAGLGNALAAALLATLVAGFGLVARRPALMHALWIVVLLKLITPPLWSVPIGLGATSSTEEENVSPGDPAKAHAVIGGLEPPTAELVFIADPQPEIVSPDLVGIVEAPAWSGPPNSETQSRGGTAPSWRVVVASTWIAGTLATFGIAAVRVRRFGRLLKEARPAPSEVLDRVDELAARLGLSRPPAVRMTPGAVSPMLWALGGRPVLIVPDDLWGRLDEPRRDTLLVHELAHLLRRDHWVRGLELLATGLYWWNPVVWWSRRALRESEEQCCDAWVVWAIPGAAHTYAEALLDTVDFLSGAEPSVPWAASGLGHVRHLKRRLVMILNGTTPRALSWSGILATLGLCAALLPLSPSWADEPPSPEPSKTFEGRADRAPDPDRPKEDVLIIQSDQGGLDESVIELKEKIVTRVHEDAKKPLQAQLDELSAKGELSKEDDIRRSAIERAIQELNRALGDRSEDADPQADKPREREGRKGADRRPEVREVRVERQDQAETANDPQPTPADSFTDNPEYQALQKRIAELVRHLAELKRQIRSQADPALRAQIKALESAKKEMDAFREKLRGERRKRSADLNKARAELREQGTDLSRKRAEFLEAQNRYHLAVERLAMMERPGGWSDDLDMRGVRSFDTWSREFGRGFPFPSPAGRPRPMIVPIPRVASPPEIEVRNGQDLARTVRPSSPPDSSRRISELEEKLNRLLKEVEGLKKEKAPKAE